ncbi:MAG: hypothetical protein COZ36_02215 [Piscirickettsiaceae bacterium CG_4_10_14_3_um_filter_44_349]|nr:hypothetical protein [Thiomicrospira sp.]PIX80461.1 MAG: hypothetical protein COZ36_02215 [Piscirickettsiaceae bacterium CG_4_10_14_3_um_filter_44_349]
MSQTNKYIQEQSHPINPQIDLFDVWNGLVEERLTIFIATMLVVLLAGFYAFLGPKTYEAKASFLPPLDKDVVDLNFPNVVDIDGRKLYQKFTENLSGPNLPYELVKDLKIREVMDKSGQDLAIDALTKTMQVNLPKEAKRKLLTGDSLLTELKVEADRAEEALYIAQKIIATAISLTKNELRDNFLLSIDEKLKVNIKQFNLLDESINQELSAEVARLKEMDEESKQKILESINLLRLKEKQDREYRIKRLELDYQLAKQLGITHPIDPLDYKRTTESNKIFDASKGLPSRYWMGTAILSAEIETLKNRNNDDPYIADMPELKRELKALEVNHRINTILARTDNLPFSESLRTLVDERRSLEEAKQKVKDAKFEVAKVVQEPLLPSKPVKPKKMLVLAAAGILGLMLGVFIALIRRAAKNRKTRMMG